MARSITNIASLKRMGIFEDRPRSAGSLNFRRYNLIYGFNGSGKSTLSRIFASLEAEALHPRLPEDGEFEIELDDGVVLGCPSNPNGLARQLLVFNSDYIDRNLQWAAGLANPVFFIGSDQAEAATELARLEAAVEKHALTRRLTAAAETAAVKSFASFKKERAKLTAARLHLGNRKYEAPALAKDYEAWHGEAPAHLTDAELSAAEETRKLSDPMPNLAELVFEAASLEKAYRFVIDMCSQSLTEVSLDEVKRFPEMLLWLKQAHEFHRDHEIETCLFCGNDVGPARIALLASAFDSKVDEFVEKVERTCERLDVTITTVATLLRTVPTSDMVSSELRARFRDAASSLLQILEETESHLRSLKAVLDEKRRRPASPADLSSLPSVNIVSETGEKLATALMSVNSLLADHNKIVKDFAEHRQIAETAIRKHFIAECRTDFARHAKELDSAADANLRSGQEAERLAREADSLRQRIRQHGPAAEIINKLVASYLGHGELTIHAIDEGYQLQRHGRPIAGLPSEGEKTAIALAYFLSSIEAERRKLKDVIVVIDDPVSSLDTKALNFACALVRGRLDGAGQLFVLTHNLQCMNEFKKGWRGRYRPTNGEPTATFLFIDTVIPEGSGRRSSKIVEMSRLLREYDSEYHYLFSHVLKFMNEPDAYYEHSYMMPNVLRRVLDVFLAFRCPGSSGFAGQIGKLCKDFPDLDRERLTALERLVQVESHSDNLDDLLTFSSMTIEEAKSAARALIAMMKHVDEKHLAALTKLCG
uniref:AAA family ATPase n=1 Tax=Ensifer adhaerens TaxID=106592 RepID=UPI003F495711